MSLEPLEGRDVPAVLADNAIALPYYTGQSDSTVQAISGVTTAPLSPQVVAFPGFRGAISAAVGDVNGDGASDLIAGARAPDGHVKVFDGRTGAALQSFFSFPGFNGAVNVGSADVNGDGYDDVLVSAGGTNGHVKAFSGNGGALLTSFFAFPGFLGRTSVSGDDFDGDGSAEILVGAGGPGVGGRVALFRADGSVFNGGMYAFPGYNGPVGVAAGDVSGDDTPDIVVGAGGPGVPGGRVMVLSGTDLGLVASFAPFDPQTASGVNVQVADATADGRAEVFTTTQTFGSPGLSRYDGQTGQVVQLYRADEALPPQHGGQPARTHGAAYYTVPIIYYGGFYNPYYNPGYYGYDYGYYDGYYVGYDDGFYDGGYYSDPGFYDPGYYDPGYYDPGFYDPGFYDPGFIDSGFYDPGFSDPGFYYGGGGDF